MEPISSVWTTVIGRRRDAMFGAAVVVVLGVILIAVGEIRDWGWTRLVGAGVISFAATLFGVLLGWSDPAWPQIRSTLRRSGRLVIIFLAVIVLVPVLAGLLVSLAGLYGSPEGTSAGRLVAGVAVTLFMLAVAGGIGVEALRLALRAASGDSQPESVKSNGKHGS